LFQLPVTAFIHAIGVRNVSPPADSIKLFDLREASKFLPYHKAKKVKEIKRLKSTGQKYSKP